MKPTYEELAKALTGLTADTNYTYDLLRTGCAPVISMGMWGRLRTAERLAARAVADIA